MFASLDIHYNNSLNNTEVHKQNETKIKKLQIKDVGSINFEIYCNIFYQKILVFLNFL